MSAGQGNTLEEFLAIKDETAVCWLGNDAWLINAGGCIAAFDLDLNNEGRLMRPSVPVEKIAEALSIHLITHEHEDHFNSATSKILAEKSSCIFVVPASCAKKASELGIPAKRTRVTSPGESLRIFNYDIKPQRALHGHFKGSVYRFASLQDCGYLMTVGGLSIYQPGDTVLLHEHFELEGIDVLFVSPTEHNTHIKNSAVMIEAMKPGYIFPQHYDTYEMGPGNAFWTKGYVDELEAALDAEAKKRFHRLKHEEIFILK